MSLETIKKLAQKKLMRELKKRSLTIYAMHQLLNKLGYKIALSTCYELRDCHYQAEIMIRRIDEILAILKTHKETK